jgi:hypothetical protein
VARSARSPRPKTVTGALKWQRRRLEMDDKMGLSTTVSFDNNDGPACLGTHRRMGPSFWTNATDILAHRSSAAAAEGRERGQLETRISDSPAASEAVAAFRGHGNISKTLNYLDGRPWFRCVNIIILPKLSKINGRIVSPRMCLFIRRRSTPHRPTSLIRRRSAMGLSTHRASCHRTVDRVCASWHTADRPCGS